MCSYREDRAETSREEEGGMRPAAGGDRIPKTFVTLIHVLEVVSLMSSQLFSAAR